MAVDHWWLGTTSTDPTVAANWSTVGSGGVPGISVPGTGDEVQFDAGGNNACTLTAHWTLGGLTVLVGYAVKLDLATFNLMMDDGANVTLDGGGEFDNGTGSHSMTNGILDNRDQTTWTRGTSHWTLNGTGSVIGHWGNEFYDLTTAVGSAITIDAATTARVVSRHRCTLNGAVVLNDALAVTGDGDFVINAGTSFLGASYLYLTNSNSGHGLTSLNAAVTAPSVLILRSIAGTRLAAGTYGGWVKVFDTGATGAVLELDNGTYDFNGGLELENQSTGTVTLDNKTNVPTINVTDLIIDTDSTGTCVIDDAAAAVDWTITGDVVDQRTGDTFTWTKGTGDILASGAAAQDWDFMDQSIEAVEVDKAGATLTLSGPATVASFAGTAGTLDPNGQTLECLGNMDWATGFVIADPAGSTFEVGGNFTADAQDLSGASAEWFLQVDGTAVASGAGDVANSNAAGHTTIDAFSGPWTDSGNNTNWKFGAVGSERFDLIGVDNRNLNLVGVDDQDFGLEGVDDRSFSLWGA